MHPNHLPLLLLTLITTHTSALAAAYPAPSTSPEEAVHLTSCTTRHALFTLFNLTYSSSEVYSTPAHLAVAEGTIAFDLVNDAFPYATHCSATSGQLTDFFYGNVVYRCDAPQVGPGGQGAGAGAVFTFSRPDGVINVNETWSCDSTRGGKNETRLGYGTGKAAFNCTTNQYTNPNWMSGEIYSSTNTNCNAPDLNIRAKAVRVG